jgi:hypothetical protein
LFEETFSFNHRRVCFTTSIYGHKRICKCLFWPKIAFMIEIKVTDNRQLMNSRKKRRNQETISNFYYLHHLSCFSFLCRFFYRCFCEIGTGYDPSSESNVFLPRTKILIEKGTWIIKKNLSNLEKSPLKLIKTSLQFHANFRSITVHKICK